MGNAQSKLEILIDAKRQGQGFQQTKTDLKEMDAAAGKLATGLGGLAALGGVAGIAALGTQAVGAAVDLARLAAQATDVEASFNQLGGASADSMLAGLKAASRGAIADFDLMLSANRAMLLGVAQNTSDMTALMDVARARSQAMGMTTADAFADIVTGIGRMSPMILDNLGIVVDQAAANKVLADSLGTTVSKLTEQEKKQALVNAVLKDSAALVKANAAAGDDAASKFERMDSAIANTKQALGEFISPGVAMGVGMLTVYLEGQIEMLENEKNALESAYVAAKNFATGGHEVTSATLAYAKAAGQADAITHNLTFGLNNLGAAGRTAGDGLTAAELKAANLATRLGQLKAQSDAAISALAGIESAAIGRLESAASGAVGVGFGAGNAAEIYAENTARIRGQIKAMEDLGLSQEYIKFKSQELADEAARPFTLAIEAAHEASRATGSYGDTLSEAEQQAKQAFDNIASMASGVLSQALQHGTGVDPDAVLEKLGLPREDAINESARRLADIAANGLKGQDWLGDFASDVPNIWQMIRTAQNPQEEAAYLLRDFQDGLLTSAIDKDKAKAIVKRQIMGDQSMAAMATEIAQEIAQEMGIPLQEALAATKGALGGGGVTDSGAEAATAFGEGAVMGLEQGSGGADFVAGYVNQMRANFSLIKTAGADAAKVWGTEFLAIVGANVPPGLVSILTQLVTPGVMASIAQKGTLTGANP